MRHILLFFARLLQKHCANCSTWFKVVRNKFALLIRPVQQGTLIGVAAFLTDKNG